MVAGEFVTFGPQPRDNALGIDQRLRAAERDERDAGRSIHWKLKLLRFRQGHAARLGTASRKGQAPTAAGLIASAAKVQGWTMTRRIPQPPLLLVTDRRQAR